MENTNCTQRKMSQQMRAVMTIISACSDIKQYAEPHIDLKLEQINWDLIFKVCWTTSQKTAIAWAFALWRDVPRPRFNVFDSSSQMDRELQTAVLKAIMIRWGLEAKAVELPNQQSIILGGVA